MATLARRGVLLTGGLIVASMTYFIFMPTLLDIIGSAWFSVWVPGEGWAQTDMPEWIYWLVQFVLPLVLAVAIVVATGLSTHAERSWWIMAVMISILVPFAAYALYLLLAYGPCLFLKCEYP